MTKGRADYWAPGDWNALCAECGRKRKASTLIQLPAGVPGSGLWVCREHWNPRQPQDYVKGIRDLQSPPWVQPQSDLNFGSLTVIDVPWTPEGYAAGSVVITGTANTVVNIPNGTTVTTLSVGTVPSGAKITVNNHGILTNIPSWPANSNVSINGVPSGAQVAVPTYTIECNGTGFI